MQLKKQPAHIVCLAETEEIVDTTLRSAPHEDAGKDDDASSAVADELVARTSFEYRVILWNERSSILSACIGSVGLKESTRGGYVTAIAWLRKS